MIDNAADLTLDELRIALAPAIAEMRRLMDEARS